MTTPSKLAASANCSATFTASWPVIASTTSSRSWGFTRFFIWASSFMSSSSMWRRPLVSTISASRRARLRADLHELVDRGGAVHVAGRQRDVHPVLLAQVAGELRAGGGLARALEARHQDHGRPGLGEGQIAAGAAHELGELLGDDLHHLLARVERLEHLLAGGALLDPGGELLDDLEVHIGLEQRQAHLAHGLGDVVLGQPAARADVAEGGLEAV